MLRPRPVLPPVLLCLLALAASPTGAQTIGNPFGELYFSAAQGERTEFNQVSTGFTSFEFFVLVDVDFADDGRPAENATNGVSAWEASVVIPPEVTVTGREFFPVGSTNAGGDENFIVTTGSAVLASSTPFAVLKYTASVNMATVPEDLVVTLDEATPNSGSTNTPNWVEDKDGTLHPFLAWDSRFVVNCVGEPECGGLLSEPLGHLYLSSVDTDRIPFNENLTGFGSFTMHLIVEVDFADLGRGEENQSNGVFAWEASIDVPADITVAGVDFMPLSSLNVGVPGNTNYIVGTGAFIRANTTPFAVAAIQCFALADPAPQDVVVTLQPAVPSSLGAGVPVWIDHLQNDTQPFATALENRFVANCVTAPECQTTPVALAAEDISFDGKRVFLQWRAPADRTFRVLRRSGSGEAFIPRPGEARRLGEERFGFTDQEPDRGVELEYRVEMLRDQHLEDAFQVSITTPLPDRMALAQNSPNPFNPQTTVRFQLSAAGPVTLSIFDARGRWVVDLVDGTRAAGDHQVTWDGRDAAGQAVGSGIYHYRLRSPEREITRSMALLR